MTQITTCPQCKTRFRVTAEQLAARRGDVRCGCCTHIFNAYATLAAETPEPPPGIEVSQPESPPETALQLAPEAEETAPQSIPAEETEALPEAPAVEIREEISAEIESLAEPCAPSKEPQVETNTEPEPESVAEIRVVRVQSPPLTIETRVSPDSPKYGPPPKPRHAWPWALASLLLLAGLAGQGTYFLRDTIAASYPPIRPMLEQACAHLQCRISLPQQPDLLSIESSELHADPARASIVVLTSTLRNRAPNVQSYPMLELTLTNIKDQMVARRIFTPGEYVRPRENVPQAAVIAQGIPAKGDVAVKLLLDLGELKAEGYRLYLFYPS